MCDCYYHKCKKCNKEFYIHIGDFAHPREDVEVFCEEHLSGEKELDIYLLLEDKEWTGQEKEEKIGIRLKNGNAKDEGIYPNCNSRFLEIIVGLII